MKVTTHRKMVCLSGTVYQYNQREVSIQHDYDLTSEVLIHTFTELPKLQSFKNFKLCNSLHGNLSVHNYTRLSSVLSHQMENTLIWVNQYACNNCFGFVGLTVHW